MTRTQEKLGPESPIFNPDPDSKPTISRTVLFTLIPKGTSRDRKIVDKSIVCLSRRNKPRIPPRQKEHLDKKFLQLLQSPRIQEPATEQAKRL
ncbi:MAG: hypothetical protein AUF79_13570 [Crenarchaeota archaeon 13_1_20CM_2_51_8]|nr:MAG: hypothetical protein AUF79_13570 [Crenarchaeota archaeon 13_1_20CM_2_51_8]